MKAFIRHSVLSPSSVPLDLAIGNFGVKLTDSGRRLAHLDFMEHKEDCDYSFRFIAKKCCLNLSNDNPALFEDLKKFVLEQALEMGIDYSCNFS